jgi:Flp pilus assembly protein TadD
MEQLYDLVANGEITAKCLVWREGWPDWKPAAEVFSEIRQQKAEVRSAAVAPALVEPRDSDEHDTPDFEPAQREGSQRTRRAVQMEIPDSDEDDNGAVGIARQFLEEDNIPEALNAAQDAIARNSEDPEAWALLGEARLRWEQFDDAISAYRQAVQLRPNDPWLYHDLGVAYHTKGDFHQAIQEHQRAARIDPQCTQFRASMGASMLANGTYNDAMSILERCVAEEPDNQTHHLLLAGSYLDRACESWTHVSDEDGSDLQYATSRKQVQESLHYIQLAEQLNFDRTEMNIGNEIAKRRETIERALRRRFDGNVLVVVAAAACSLIGFAIGGMGILVGLYFLFAGGLYVASCFAPNYSINRRDLIRHGLMPTTGFFEEVGKGMQERKRERAAEEGLSGFFGDMIFGTVWKTLFLPVVIIMNFVKNYAN